MKLLGFLPVLSTLLPLSLLSSAVAEPIPADVRVHSFRSLHGGSEIVESISKRALTDDLFSTNGAGARYWAWSKLAYDGDYNDQAGKNLGDATGKAWAKLGGSDIFVKGFAGQSVVGSFEHWPSFTGMKVIVGTDTTNKVIVMAFIGSNDIPTFKQDLKFFEDTDASLPGKVEKGFHECYQAVSQQAFDWVKQAADGNTDYDIVITGHSLGGATAHIAAVGFVAAYPDYAARTTVFTYGAPRAGDLTFQQALATNQGDRMANFQHIHDEVPLVPPIIAGFANPAKRWMFDGDGASWFDESKYTAVADADTTRHLWRGVISIAKDIKDGFAEHTGYFAESGSAKRNIRPVDDLKAAHAERNIRPVDDPKKDNAKRNIRPVDDLKTDARSMHRRDEPDSDDLAYAEGLVGQMMQSHELDGDATLTSNLEDFTTYMKITGEQGDLVDAINTYPDGDERIEFLKIVELVALEQA